MAPIDEDKWIYGIDYSDLAVKPGAESTAKIINELIEIRSC